MILLLDLNDSFVFTLAGYVEELGAKAEVIRARDTTIEGITALNPERIILSPGPRTPREFPIAIEVIRQLGPTVPVLGVCLGHQCVAAAFGATVGRTQHPRHGRSSPVTHDGRGIFEGVPSPFLAARYHSLAVVASSVPPDIHVTAVADDGDIMGIRHATHPIEGVQFHPESVLTEWGHRMLANFLSR